MKCNVQTRSTLGVGEFRNMLAPVFWKVDINCREKTLKSFYLAELEPAASHEPLFMVKTKEMKLRCEPFPAISLSVALLVLQLGHILCYPSMLGCAQVKKMFMFFFSVLLASSDFLLNSLFQLQASL